MMLHSSKISWMEVCDLIKVYLHFLEICNFLGQIKSNVGSPTNGNETWVSDEFQQNPETSHFWILLRRTQPNSGPHHDKSPAESWSLLLLRCRSLVDDGLVGQRGELWQSGRERTSAASSGGEATSWLSRLQPASQQPPSCLTTIAREIFSQRVKKRRNLCQKPGNC